MSKLAFLFLTVSLMLSAFPSVAVTIHGSPTVYSEEYSSERYLRGDFVAYDRNTHVLQTSIGDFNLPSATQVLDRRTDQEAPAQVSIKFRGDIAVEVTIYQ